MIRFEPGKYRQTVLLVALFLVINLCVLGASLWVADRFRADAQAVELVARQGALIERMTRASLQLEARSAQGLPVTELVRELEEAPQMFQTTLDALARGGEV